MTRDSRYSAVLLPGRGEDVYEDGGFEGGGLVLSAAGDHPAVAGGELTHFVSEAEATATGNEITGLLVRMGMQRDNSAGLHAHFAEHHAIAVGDCAADDARKHFDRIGSGVGDDGHGDSLGLGERGDWKEGTRELET
jgi:hypothetical protein